jgi:hypothetical protein
MREFGSFAVFALVSFFFIPLILAQKESRREPPSGWGRFKFIPCAFAEARPLAFKPPSGFLPSFLVHAGDLAIINCRRYRITKANVNTVGAIDTFTGNLNWQSYGIKCI